ncbi:MAG: nuclear transport factor 2 family protein [Micropepsaceae bacterium]
MGPNEKALRDSYAAYLRGESVVDAFAENIFWTSVGAPNRIDTAGEWRGLDGVRQYYEALAAHWTLSDFSIEEVVGTHDRRFAVRIRVTAKSHTTDKSVTFEKIDFVSMTDGKITNYSEIYDTAPLIRAARLG